MTAFLLDTHVWAWVVTEPRRLTFSARTALEAADTVCLSAVSFYEIAQKVRLGKWPEMAPDLDRLEDILEQRGGRVLGVSASLSREAGSIDWLHRDPFDRFIAATAMALDLPLVSADPVFDSLPLRRVW